MGGGERMPGQLGKWGDFGAQPQKGIVTYGLSPNRQRPLGGTLHAAIFNSYRRSKSSAWKFAFPFVTSYFILDWADKRNHYLNSKEGREKHGAM